MENDMKQKRLTVLAVAILVALLAAAVVPFAVLAQDETPPPPDAPVVDEPAMDALPAEGPTLSETIAQAPDGDALRQSAFQRRVMVNYGPPIGMVYVHSPEDLILYKLMYLGLSGQPKHARDIAAILRAKKST
jgi:hypothetical protein